MKKTTDERLAEMASWPSAADLQAMTQRGRSEAGWECPRCACRHTVVRSTYEAMGGTRRRRFCRHCGYGPVHTLEVEVPKGHTLQIVPPPEEDVA